MIPCGHDTNLVQLSPLRYRSLIQILLISCHGYHVKEKHSQYALGQRH